MNTAVLQLEQVRCEHAHRIAEAGDVTRLVGGEVLGERIDTTVSEALVWGLLAQGVRTFFCVFGHGSTEIGEVLRIYQAAGLLRVCGVRNEIEASHAAMALRWVRDEKAAVVTSIGPGALQALAASLAPRSDGVGVWYLLGDETTEDEGPNMQQVPGTEQAAFLRLFATMGQAYLLHTPWALPIALRRGLNAVEHPHRAGPFFLLLPLNVQPTQLASFNVAELPIGAPPPLGPAADGGIHAAVTTIAAAERVVVRIGGGARACGAELMEFIELADAVAVTSPLVSGVMPYAHPRNMTVGGSKGSLCGNYAMESADLLVVVGSRSVCQADSSRTGYPQVERVININADPDAAMHYNKTTALIGDAASTLRQLNQMFRAQFQQPAAGPSAWLRACGDKKRQWVAYKRVRYRQPVLYDPVWGREVLTQPAAIKVATDWARNRDAVCFFDAGDVQANGFQIVEDDHLGQTFTETGASYMGFAVSALLATAVASEPFYGLAISGDGSFTMNPQILIDGVEHGATGCILLLDNRRMGAITGLQVVQYGVECATRDSVQVDYLAWARAVKGLAAFDGGHSPETLQQALEQAVAHKGLSLIHVAVYFGLHELGGFGAYGRWNVGNWCADTQAMRHEIGL